MNEKKKLFFVFVVIIVIFAVLVLWDSSQRAQRVNRGKEIESVSVDTEEYASGYVVEEDSNLADETNGEGEEDISLLEMLEEQKKYHEDEKASKEEKIQGILGKLLQQGEEVSQEPPLPARVFNVKKVRYENALPVTGDIKSSKEIKMRFEKEGVIDKIMVKEGDRVKEGEIIAILNKKDSLLAIARAQGKLDSDTAALGAAEKELELNTLLYDKGAIIESKLQEVKLRIESERAKVRVSQEEFKMATSSLEKTELRSPIDGIVGSRDAEEGEFFTPRDIVVNLLGLKDVYAEVGVVERDIHKASIGQTAVIKVDAYPNKEFIGKVGNLYPIVEGRSRTMKAEVNIVDEEKVLLPGMFAQVSILLAKFDSEIMVPTMSLLQMTPDVVVIPVVKLDQGIDLEKIKRGEGSGTITFREVKIGYMGPDYTQILSGIKESDIIVLEAHGEVEDGRKLRILGLEEYGI
ncbi:MAG: efflux RND transporter periplasmic adaptor subunit [Candidatus Omnitrophota bacterium]|nr:efflux RND transporter periplasmic adaptor subunit [Candidatus Omnitrophota bacterium]